jgi:hypothetical protein
MHSAQPFRRDLFRATAGELREDKRMRSIVLHFEPGTTSVDGFACSACDWFYLFTSSEPDGTLPRHEVDEAHARFAEHICAEYPKVRIWDDAP